MRGPKPSLPPTRPFTGTPSKAWGVTQGGDGHSSLPLESFPGVFSVCFRFRCTDASPGKNGTLGEGQRWFNILLCPGPVDPSSFAGLVSLYCHLLEPPGTHLRHTSAPTESCSSRSFCPLPCCRPTWQLEDRRREAAQCSQAPASSPRSPLLQQPSGPPNLRHTSQHLSDMLVVFHILFDS